MCSLIVFGSVFLLLLAEDSNQDGPKHVGR